MMLCRQSQVVFPLVHMYLSCLSFFNPCSSGLPDNLLDVCCCQGADFRVQVLYHIPQQQQYVRSYLVPLRTSWHKGCAVSHPARESPGKNKIASRVSMLPVLLGPRHLPWLRVRWGTQSFLPFLRACQCTYGRHQSIHSKSHWNKPLGIFPTRSLK